MYVLQVSRESQPPPDWPRLPNTAKTSLPGIRRWASAQKLTIATDSLLRFHFEDGLQLRGKHFAVGFF